MGAEKLVKQHPESNGHLERQPPSGHCSGELWMLSDPGSLQHHAGKGKTEEVTAGMDISEAFLAPPLENTLILQVPGPCGH